jgi:hypothetical protein
VHLNHAVVVGALVTDGSEDGEDVVDGGDGVGVGFGFGSGAVWRSTCV